MPDNKATKTKLALKKNTCADLYFQIIEHNFSNHIVYLDNTFSETILRQSAGLATATEKLCGQFLWNFGVSFIA
jgi:hypothetical protein